MEDSLKGLLITVTLILIFITCMINFMVLFPAEQGVTFSGADQAAYLTVANNTNQNINPELQTLSNSSTNAFNTWDVTVGFMGSNSMKQGQLNIFTLISQTFSSLVFMATLLFNSGSPVLLVLGILSTLSGIIIVYYIYAFVRTGR